jgi:hypothetical protein
MTWVLLRALVVGLLIAAVEVVHGMVRWRWLHRPLGARRASQVGVGVGIGLNFAVAWWCLPWVVGGGPRVWWAIGAVWLAVLLALDVVFGRGYLRYPWRRIARDFDPRQGGWLGLGMLALALTPWVVAVLRGW